MTSEKKKRKTSVKRKKAGKKLAASLPRDKKGKFLPRGSKNLFKKKRKRKASSNKTRKRTAGANTAKRRRIASGPRRVDEFANFIVAQLVVAAAVGELRGTTRVQTPLPRIKTSGKRATILEILWVDFVVPTMSINFDRDDINSILVVQLSIGSAPIAGSLPFDDPRVFAHKELHSNFLKETSGNTRILFPVQPLRCELQTRGTGAGYLLTAEAFNLTVEMIGQNVAFGIDVVCKVWYRFVEVSLDEFVGLVQSTQQQ